MLRWPIPAVLAWALAWGVYRGLLLAGVDVVPSLLGATALGVVLGAWAGTWWRRLIVAAGFPFALLLTGPANLPPWVWLVLLLLLAALYPVTAWRDAPLFPTPQGALRALAQHAPLPAGALVLDAGCGLGHGLRELRLAYPQAQLHGIEWSWPLRALCAWRCRWARVRQGDIWRADWAPYKLVYLFQRPESMARAAHKAAREMRPGSWLVSLEFDVPGLAAQHSIVLAQGRRVWLYRLPALPDNANSQSVREK